MAFQPPTEQTESLLALQLTSIETFRSNLSSPSAPPSPSPPTLVLCVTRPSLPDEPHSFPRVTTDGGKVHVHKAAGKAGLIDKTGKIQTKSFQVHSSFGVDATSEDVYKSSVEDLVESASVKGVDTFVVCYGQTGSGKTHTATNLLSLSTSHPATNVAQISSFELRGSLCSDLLSTPPRETRKVLTDETGMDVVQHLTVIDVASAEDIRSHLSTAATYRRTASTLANPQSSRSHCFTTLCLSGGGSLTFVDLAGAEGKEDVAAHCENGDAEERLKEMKEINGSLGDLKECIRLNLVRAKETGNNNPAHVPYRRSLLTRLLRRALDPSLKPSATLHTTTFLAHVAPGGGSQFKGTVNTLNYAEFMVRASREEEERGRFKGPEAWKSGEVVRWVESLGGEYVALGEVFVLTGKQLAIMWQGDVEKRVLAAGGSRENADFLYNTFREMVADAKKKARKKEGVGRRLAPVAKGFGRSKGGVEGATGAAVIYGAGLSAECVENSSKGGGGVGGAS